MTIRHTLTFAVVVGLLVSSVIAVSAYIGARWEHRNQCWVAQNLALTYRTPVQGREEIYKALDAMVERVCGGGS